MVMGTTRRVRRVTKDDRTAATDRLEQIERELISPGLTEGQWRPPGKKQFAIKGPLTESRTPLVAPGGLALFPQLVWGSPRFFVAPAGRSLFCDSIVSWVA